MKYLTGTMGATRREVAVTCRLGQVAEEIKCALLPPTAERRRPPSSEN